MAIPAHTCNVIPEAKLAVESCSATSVVPPSTVVGGGAVSKTNLVVVPVVCAKTHVILISKSARKQHGVTSCTRAVITRQRQSVVPSKALYTEGSILHPHGFTVLEVRIFHVNTETTRLGGRTQGVDGL